MPSENSVIHTHFYTFALLFFVSLHPLPIPSRSQFASAFFEIALRSLSFFLSISLSPSFLSLSLSFSLSPTLSALLSLKYTHTHTSESPRIKGRHRYSFGCSALNVQCLESRWMYVHYTWKFIIPSPFYAQHCICDDYRFLVKIFWFWRWLVSEDLNYLFLTFYLSFSCPYSEYVHWPSTQCSEESDAACRRQTTSFPILLAEHR